MKTHKYPVVLTCVFLTLLGSVSLIDSWSPMTSRTTMTTNDQTQSSLGRKTEHFLSDPSQTFQHYETKMERSSSLRRSLSGYVQTFLTHHLSLGNEHVAVTALGLVYRDDVKWVTGPDFLSQSGRMVNQGRKMTSHAISGSDPRPAILQFAQALEDRVLILAPIPNKAMFLGGDQNLLNNAGFTQFMEEMTAVGIPVFWPFGPNANGLKTSYLYSDTHWNPSFMEDYARSLRTFLGRHDLWSPTTRPLYRQAAPQSVKNQGDLARMLNLKSDTGYETAMIRPVTTLDGRPWRPHQDAAFLILGDSYVTVFSESAMGWGAQAGLAPTLSFLLQMDLDVIALNGAAPTQTRSRLARRSNPLGGKRVVLWFFAIRELAFGDWRPVPIPMKPDQDVGDSQQLRQGLLRVRAKLITPPGGIDPLATPYPNAVINLQFEVLTVFEGAFPDRELLAQMPIMLDRRLTDVVKMVPGEIYELALSKEGPDHVQNWTLLDETDAYHLDVWWVHSKR